MLLSCIERTDINPRTNSLELDDDVEVLDDGSQEDSASSGSRAPGSAPSGARRDYQADLLNDKAVARTAGAAAVTAKKNK